MKRTVSVITTKEYEIDIPDELLTPEQLAEFSTSMWPVSEPYEMFKYAATQIAQYDSGFIEGLRQTVPEHLKQFADVPEPITFNENFSHIETEML